MGAALLLSDNVTGKPLHFPLPVPLPRPRHARRHSRPHNAMSLRAVVDAAVVFAPCHFAGVGVQIRPGDMVVRADFGAAQAREVAFGLVRASALVLERDRVIDAVRLPTGMESVPTAAFVGVDGGEGANVIADERNRIAFVGDDER